MTSVASFKDRLSRIADEVHAAADPGSGRPRRRSTSSPVANGAGADADTGSLDEIAKYKADIQKLKESEAEIKALSFNYAAILKDKEEQLSKLREENSSLRTNLDAKSVAVHDISYDNHKQLPNSSNMPKLGSSNMIPSQGTADQLPIRPRHTNQFNSRSTGNYAIKGNASRQDNFSNGSAQAIQHDAIQRKVELKSANSLGNGKEHTNMLEESHKSLLAVQANLESEIIQLKLQLDNEREGAASIKLQLQEEQRLNEHSQKDLQNLKKDNESMSVEIQDLYKKLSEKISELGRQQVESRTKNLEEMDNCLKDMNDRISILENENNKLKIEKDELEASLKVFLKDTPRNLDDDDLSYPNRKSSELNEATEKMTQSIIQLEDSLRETCKERDKALQELARLKQHLLEKELVDEDKMDEDSKIIDELKVNSDYQRAQILQLEKALRQEVAKKEEFVKLKSDEVRRLNEIIVGLNQKVTDCMRTVDSKNMELLNLQTALGQYYAEIDAKEHLGRDLYMAREESTKLSESLRVSKEMLETVKREKEEIATKLSQAERNLLECKFSIQKLEDDNSKLRSALEQSMTTLNRMSLDSDNYVDRRIVIKLLVTYFQRNHSKEVLDLMVRMLGFPEEDKQRIGVAQQAAGKGVVRGVLGLPGRLVGGIIGGNSPEVASHRSSDNQSFADLWVDFLLKENEERERRESSEAAARMSSRTQDRSTNTRASSAYDRTSLPSIAGPSAALPINQTSSHHPKQNLLFEHSDSEFATVPLTSSGPSVESSSSRPPPRY